MFIAPLSISPTCTLGSLLLAFLLRQPLHHVPYLDVYCPAVNLWTCKLCSLLLVLLLSQSACCSLPFLLCKYRLHVSYFAVYRPIPLRCQCPQHVRYLLPPGLPSLSVIPTCTLPSCLLLVSSAFNLPHMYDILLFIARFLRFLLCQNFLHVHYLAVYRLISSLFFSQCFLRVHYHAVHRFISSLSISPTCPCGWLGLKHQLTNPNMYITLLFIAWFLRFESPQHVHYLAVYR